MAAMGLESTEWKQEAQGDVLIISALLLNRSTRGTVIGAFQVTLLFMVLVMA